MIFNKPITLLHLCLFTSFGCYIYIKQQELNR